MSRRAKRWMLIVALVLLLGAILGRGLLQQGQAWLNGMQAYLYGFPLMVMDVTKEASTAVPTAAPSTATTRSNTRVVPGVSRVRAKWNPPLVQQKQL